MCLRVRDTEKRDGGKTFCVQAGHGDGGRDANIETEQNKQTDRKACSQKHQVGGGEEGG